MGLILVDTSSYLKLSKSLHPMLGRHVGAPPRNCVVLSELDREIDAKPTLFRTFYWLLEPGYVDNRKHNLLSAVSVGLQEVREWREQVTSWVNASRRAFKVGGMTPPSPADALLIAYAIALSEQEGHLSAVVSDDRAVRFTVEQLGLCEALSGWQLLQHFHAAKLVSTDDVRAIFGHLLHLQELPRDWRENSAAAFGFTL
jgi:hypothetical protein